MIRLEYFSTFQNETAQVFSTFFKNMWNIEGNSEVCLGLKLQQQTKVEKLQRFYDVHMNHRKNEKVIMIKSLKMAVSSAKFGNFFFFDKCQLKKLENFKKRLLHWVG